MRHLRKVESQPLKCSAEAFTTEPMPAEKRMSTAPACQVRRGSPNPSIASLGAGESSTRTGKRGSRVPSRGGDAKPSAVRHLMWVGGGLSGRLSRRTSTFLISLAAKNLHKSVDKDASLNWALEPADFASPRSTPPGARVLPPSAESSGERDAPSAPPC